MLVGNTGNLTNFDSKMAPLIICNLLTTSKQTLIIMMCLMSVMKRTKDETKVILTEDDFSQKVHCEKSEKLSTAFFLFHSDCKNTDIFL